VDILGLTTTEAVRAFIGIDEAAKELPDQLFYDLEIEDALRLEFSRWLPITIETLVALGERSSDGVNLAYLAARQAARAWCAMEVLQAAEISIASKHSDGQNEFVRQTYKVADLLLRLSAVYNRYRDLVLEELDQPSTTAPSWMVSRAIPDYDPVTNRSQ
jgi:hypothetical protein